MKITQKLLVGCAAGAVSGYLLGSLVGFAKLASLGKTSWEGHVTFGVPLMYIKSDTQGFVAQTEYGVFVIAVAGALIAGLAVLCAAHIQKTRINSKSRAIRTSSDR